jgi:transposase
VTDAECRKLTALAHRPRSAPSLARRAPMILACTHGRDNQVVARRLRIAPATVAKWRGRFLTDRVDGLLDELHPGAPRTIRNEDIDRVVTVTIETTPDTAIHWNTGDLARRTGTSPRTVSRIWRAVMLKPHSGGTSRIFKDPLFRVRDVVGLYLNTPDRAPVLAADERSQIQALDRSEPMLPMRPGQLERRPVIMSATAPRPGLPLSTSRVAP